jgi:hypothetical protein
MLRTSTSAALSGRIAHLEARLAPVPRAEPFMHQDVVAEVEQGAAEYRARVTRIAERWRVAPEESAPWEGRTPLEKLVAAATPEQASRLLQRLQERSLLAESAFVRRRGEQFFAAYGWLCRRRVGAVRGNAGLECR